MELKQSFAALWDYLEYCDPGRPSIGESFGTENFSLLFYSLIRMQQPEVLVELGTGAGVTTLLAAAALKHNRKGHLWTVDDGSEWSTSPLRQRCQAAIGFKDEQQSYSDFIEALLSRFAFEDVVTPVSLSMDNGTFFSPGPTIDFLFADATPSDARGCADLLRFYLPKMNPYSSIFIDRASTIHHSALFLNQIVDYLRNGRVPTSLLLGLEADERSRLQQLVECSSFSIVHLVETAAAKLHNPSQNSRAWIRIEPLDYVHHNNVITYGLASHAEKAERKRNKE